MTKLERALTRITSDLRQLGVKCLPWAGALAGSSSTIAWDGLPRYGSSQPMRHARASAPHLVALKLLADRLQDRADVESLLAHVDEVGRGVIRSSLERIAQRGFDRGSDLPTLFERALRVHAGADEES